MFSYNSTFLDQSTNSDEFKRVSVMRTGESVRTGNDEFMEWMSSLNPALRNQYRTLSRESQLKLRGLYTMSQQANGSVGEVVKTIDKCGQEYEALAERISHHLQTLGVEAEDLSGETQKSAQELATIVSGGNVGDGTDAGAAAALAINFLNQTSTAQQKLALSKEIKLIKKRNERLKENVQFLERERKAASDELSSSQAALHATIVDLDVSRAKQSNLSGLPPSISNEAILDTFNEYNSVRNEIKLLEGKLQQYGELPPSITQASEVVQSTKRRLESVSNDLKLKLTAEFRRRK